VGTAFQQLPGGRRERVRHARDSIEL
jgi:hypothetical protein